MTREDPRQQTSSCFRRGFAFISKELPGTVFERNRSFLNIVDQVETPSVELFYLINECRRSNEIDICPILLFFDLDEILSRLTLNDCSRMPSKREDRSLGDVRAKNEKTNHLPSSSCTSTWDPFCKQRILFETVGVPVPVLPFESCRLRFIVDVNEEDQRMLLPHSPENVTLDLLNLEERGTTYHPTQLLLHGSEEKEQQSTQTSAKKTLSCWRWRHLWRSLANHNAIEHFSTKIKSKSSTFVFGDFLSKIGVFLRFLPTSIVLLVIHWWRPSIDESFSHSRRSMTRREQINWLILLIGFAREWINPTFRNSSLISFCRWNRVSHFNDTRDRTYILICSFPSITQLTMPFNSVSLPAALRNIHLTFSLCRCLVSPFYWCLRPRLHQTIDVLDQISPSSTTLQEIGQTTTDPSAHSTHSWHQSDHWKPAEDGHHR